MICLYAIIRDYFMIIHDYFYDYFYDYFPIISDYTRLFFLLFTIISLHRHPENGNMQTAILDPITE